MTVCVFGAQPPELIEELWRDMVADCDAFHWWAA